jgi:hypothetical protein
MTNAVTPITSDTTTYSGVLPSNAVGRGCIQSQQVIQTVYPTGATVTRIYLDQIEVYDHHAMITQHNQSHVIDQMA